MWCIAVFLTLLLCWLVYATFRQVVGRFKVSGWREKSVFITGCDSGFGYDAALAFASLGVRVFAGCLTPTGLTQLRQKWIRTNLHPVQLDITSDDSVSAAVAYVNEHSTGSGLWALINNAAIEGINGPDDFLSLNDYRQHCEVNVFGTIRVTKAFKPLLKKVGGRLIFTTSIKGRLVFPETGPYTLTKWAIESYADNLRQDLYYFGVSVHVIQPGGFRSPLVNNVSENFKASWQRLPQSVKEEYGGEFFQSRLNCFNQMQEGLASDRTPVVNAYVHAALSIAPHSRYLVGSDVILLYWPVSFLPEILQDWWFRRRMRHTWSPPESAVSHRFSH